MNAYMNMQSMVQYQGVTSDLFPVQQSSRQGSHWGTFFYLAFIDPCLHDITKSNLGAYVGDTYAGVHAQADDIAIVATSKCNLQSMMDICYDFSLKWRFIIHPDKSKVLVYNESRKWANENFLARSWKLGGNVINQVQSHMHCGVLFSSINNSVDRTKTACRKGRGIMSAICNTGGLGQGKMNPMTAVKLYKAITLPSALYGCEIWNQLTRNEILMLERMQRYCCKLMQGLCRKTRSNICCGMLGLLTVEGHINSSKLKFFRRLCVLPEYHLSKQIFLRRLFQSKFLPTANSGYCKDVIEKLHTYDLRFALDSFCHDGTSPDKLPWKKLVSCAIQNFEKNQFQMTVSDDLDFERFIRIHPDIFVVNPIWRVAKEYPVMLQKCLDVCKIITSPPNKETILCEYCGHTFHDFVEHYICNCPHTLQERETFWEIINNSQPIDIACNLHNVCDTELCDILLGAPCDFICDRDSHSSFLVICINFLSKLLDQVQMY